VGEATEKSAAIGMIAAVVAIAIAGAGLTLYRSHEEAQIGRLDLSTQGEVLAAIHTFAAGLYWRGSPFAGPFAGARARDLGHEMSLIGPCPG
jgi:hypothetical protein